MSDYSTEAQHAFDAIQALDDKSVDNVYRNVQEWSPMAVASAAAAVAVGAEVDYQPLEFLNGFRDHGGEWAPGRYRRLVNVVRLSGLISRDEPLTGESLDICYLPEGSRPDAAEVFSAPADGNNLVRIDVFPDGLVLFRGYIHGTSGAEGWISLAQISFSIGVAEGAPL